MAESTAQHKRAPSLEDEMAAIKEDVARLRDDIASLAGAMKDVASGYNDQAKTGAKEKVARAKAQVDEQIDRVMAGGREAMDGVESRIVERPVASLLTAATFGFILAKLLEIGGRR